MLDSNDAFVLDTAQQLFVWIGKKATKDEKNKAWDIANVRRQRPGSTRTQATAFLLIVVSRCPPCVAP